MNSSDLEPNSFFTTNGKDIWKLGTFCLSPTCTLINLETGEEESFGMNGFTAQNFNKITMPMKAIADKITDEDNKTV